MKIIRTILSKIHGFIYPKCPKCDVTLSTYVIGTESCLICLNKECEKNIIDYENI